MENYCKYSGVSHGRQDMLSWMLRPRPRLRQPRPFTVTSVELYAFVFIPFFLICIYIYVYCTLSWIAAYIKRIQVDAQCVYKYKCINVFLEQTVTNKIHPGIYTNAVH